MQQCHEMSGPNQDFTRSQGLGSALAPLCRQRGERPCVVWGVCPSLDGAELWFAPGSVYFFFPFLLAADIYCRSIGPTCLHHCCWMPASDTKVYCCPIGPACSCCFLPLLWGHLLHLVQLPTTSGPTALFCCCTEVFTTL